MIYKKIANTTHKHPAHLRKLDTKSDVFTENQFGLSLTICGTYNYQQYDATGTRLYDDPDRVLAVAWREGDPRTSSGSYFYHSIKWQIFSKSGIRKLSNPRGHDVVAPQLIRKSPPQIRPSIASLSNGNVIIAWTSNVYLGDTYLGDKPNIKILGKSGSVICNNTFRQTPRDPRSLHSSAIPYVTVTALDPQHVFVGWSSVEGVSFTIVDPHCTETLSHYGFLSIPNFSNDYRFFSSALSESRTCLSWTQDTYSHYFQIIHSKGTNEFNTPQKINTDTPGATLSASANTEGIYFAWASNYKIFLKTYFQNGTAVENKEHIVASSERMNGAPFLAAFPNKDCALTFNKIYGTGLYSARALQIISFNGIPLLNAPKELSGSNTVDMLAVSDDYLSHISKRYDEHNFECMQYENNKLINQYLPKRYDQDSPGSQASTQGLSRLAIVSLIVGASVCALCCLCCALCCREKTGQANKSTTYPHRSKIHADRENTATQANTTKPKTLALTNLDLEENKKQKTPPIENPQKIESAKKREIEAAIEAQERLARNTEIERQNREREDAIAQDIRAREVEQQQKNERQNELEKRYLDMKRTYERHNGSYVPNSHENWTSELRDLDSVHNKVYPNSCRIS